MDQINNEIDAELQKYSTNTKIHKEGCFKSHINLQFLLLFGFFFLVHLYYYFMTRGISSNPFNYLVYIIGALWLLCGLRLLFTNFKCNK